MKVKQLLAHGVSNHRFGRSSDLYTEFTFIVTNWVAEILVDPLASFHEKGSVGFNSENFTLHDTPSTWRAMEELYDSGKGYSPLGSPGTTWLKRDVLKHPVLNMVAGKLGKSTVQVALRWGIQMCHSVLPKGTNEVRIKENFDVFGWSIPDELLLKFFEIEQGAGIAIRPHLPVLVCCMLESLSSLEDQRLNYVELHASNIGIHAEKLENLRIAVAKDSPMWETLDLCLKVVDTQSLDLLVPRLAQMIRSGVGLNTRVGVASFIGLLVQKIGPDITPFTSMLLKLLFPAILEERSGSAKRAFASACAIILKYAAPSQAQKLMEDTAALHTGDRNAQISCATDNTWLALNPSKVIASVKCQRKI